MDNLYSLASIGNILIGLALLIGGYMAFKSGKHRTSGEIQDQTINAQDQAINALKVELEALQRRLDVVERENTRLHQTINLIKSALSKRGYKVTIDGDMVEITSQNGSSYSRIQETPPQRPASKPAPRPQWMRHDYQDETIADLPANNQQTE